MKKSCLLLVVLVVMLSILQPVTVSAASFSLTATQTTLIEGASKKLTVPGIKTQKIKWKSSNSKIVKVSTKGVIVGKKPGKAVITGKYGKVTLKCSVRVYPKEFNIVLLDNIKIRVELKSIQSNGMINLSVKNKTNKDICIGAEYYTINGEYTDAWVDNADGILPPGITRTIKTRIEDKKLISNVKNLTARYYLYDADSGYHTNYYTIKKITIK